MIRRLPTLLLITAIFCVGISGILAKRAFVEATPLALAAWRLGFASLFFLSAYRFTAKRGARPPLTRIEKVRLACGGAALVLHFLTWYGSLTLTKVAISTLLCSSTPLWTALINMLSGRQRERGLFWISLLVAGIGVAFVIQPHGQAMSSRALLGAVLATIGGLAFSLYLWCVDGHQHLTSQRIVTNTYSAAAVILWALLIFTHGVTIHYSASVWEAILLVTLIPQIMGHTLLNNSLRYFTATVVAFCTLVEPVIAAVLAHFLLGERITPAQIGGGALVLISLALVLAGGQKSQAQPAMAEEL
ncbi:MAG TPA: DMT family transporter [Capsulimonadaceae bacterium]|nr:DMT family transporter [Capsulimonadaceae bacterium]